MQFSMGARIPPRNKAACLFSDRFVETTVQRISQLSSVIGKSQASKESSAKLLLEQ